MRGCSIIRALGLMAVSVAFLTSAPAPTLADGEIVFPEDYFGRVSLPFAQRFQHVKQLLDNTNNFEPIKAFSANNRYRRMAAPIGRLDIVVRANGNVGMGFCTGWVISPQYIMTNNHCIPSHGGTVLQSAIVMNYLSADDPSSAEIYQVDPKPVETNVDLDYSVLRVHGDPGARYGYIPLATRDPIPNEELFIIQHPAGQPQRLTRRDCRVASGTARPDEVVHQCYSLGGSSGSPLFSDNDMALVGLHFAGTKDNLFFAKRMTAILRQSALLRRIAGAMGGGGQSGGTIFPQSTGSRPVAPAKPAPQRPAPSSGGGWQVIN